MDVPIHLRTYDHRNPAPQPTGPIEIYVPGRATDEEIVGWIERDFADHSRPFRIEPPRDDCDINPGWKLIYDDSRRQHLEVMR